MSSILILVGTMSGTAEMVADEIADQLDDAGFDSRVMRMEKVNAHTVAAAERVIICTSTYGTGEVPDNAKNLLASLSESRPDLSHVSYGLFALGSGRYPQTFCFGGKHFARVFDELGAALVGEHFRHDDRGGVHAEDAASAWIADWIEAVRD